VFLTFGLFGCLFCLESPLSGCLGFLLRLRTAACLVLSGRAGCRFFRCSGLALGLLLLFRLLLYSD